MLRITELKLPLDHSETAIKTAVLKKLGINAEDLITISIYRQGHDARNKSTIYLVYTLDIELKNEAEVLARHQDDINISVTPDNT